MKEWYTKEEAANAGSSKAAAANKGGLTGFINSFRKKEEKHFVLSAESEKLKNDM